MSERFYYDTIRRLIDSGWLRVDDEVLVVAGGLADRDVLRNAGLRAVTISNLDERMHHDEYAPFAWSYQNAEMLTIADSAFDVCIVHQGLHHCRSPHRGLVEMYRVARRGIVVFEPQDTLLTRIGVRLGIGQRYEWAAVAGNDLRWGGVENSDIPNFVYRWTARDAYKTLATYDPTGEPRLRFYYDLRVPDHWADSVRSWPARMMARVAVPAARMLLHLFPRQANAIAIVVDKLDPAVDLHPWLEEGGSGARLDASWFERRSAPNGRTVGEGAER
jgi:SAM-dependent methyltransferase